MTTPHVPTDAEVEELAVKLDADMSWKDDPVGFIFEPIARWILERYEPRSDGQRCDGSGRLMCAPHGAVSREEMKYGATMVIWSLGCPGCSRCRPQEPTGENANSERESQEMVNEIRSKPQGKVTGSYEVGSGGPIPGLDDTGANGEPVYRPKPKATPKGRDQCDVTGCYDTIKYEVSDGPHGLSPRTNEYRRCEKHKPNLFVFENVFIHKSSTGATATAVSEAEDELAQKPLTIRLHPEDLRALVFALMCHDLRPVDAAVERGNYILNLAKEKK